MAEAVLHFGLEVTGITSRGVEVVSVSANLLIGQ
jgi:hypothetical protein